MKIISALLIALLVILQYHLWVGNGSLAEVWRTKQAIVAQKQENSSLQERNLALDAEVADIKNGLAAIEERARSELGMVGKDETFYQIVSE